MVLQLATIFYFLVCEFKCEADNKCIKQAYECSGYPSCSDGQDEKDCP